MQLVVKGSIADLRSKAPQLAEKLASILDAYDPGLATRIRKAISPTAPVDEFAGTAAGTTPVHLPPSGPFISGRHVRYGGFRVVIENEPGSMRQFAGGALRMKTPYGYLQAIDGEDGDRLDCYLGSGSPLLCPSATIVHQLNPDGTYDEDKVFLGFDSPRDALDCFRAHRDDFDDAFGGMSVVGLDKLREIVRHLKTAPTRKERRFGAPRVLATGLVPEDNVFLSPRGYMAIHGQPIPIAPVGVDEPAPIEAHAPAAKATGWSGNPSFNGGDGIGLAMSGPRAIDLEVAPVQTSTVTTYGDIRAVPPEVTTRAVPNLIPDEPPALQRILEPPAEPVSLDVEHNKAAVEQRAAQIDSAAALPTNETVARPTFVTKCNKRGLGEVTVRKFASGAFGVTIHADDADGPSELAFDSMRQACDHVWARQKGFEDAEAARDARCEKVLPSGAGWKFWGVSPCGCSTESVPQTCPLCE